MNAANGEYLLSVAGVTYPLQIFNFIVRVDSGLNNVCKTNFRVFKDYIAFQEFSLAELFLIRK